MVSVYEVVMTVVTLVPTILVVLITLKPVITVLVTSFTSCARQLNVIAIFVFLFFYSTTS